MFLVMSIKQKPNEWQSHVFSKSLTPRLTGKNAEHFCPR